MEAITMSSRSLFLTTLLLSASSAVCAAPKALCPQKHMEGKVIGVLFRADVFDGVPANKADLIPDLRTWEWDLSLGQEDAKQRGDSFYLVCRYKGINATIDLKVPYSARYCKVDGIKGGIYAACR